MLIGFPWKHGSSKEPNRIQIRPYKGCHFKELLFLRISSFRENLNKALNGKAFVSMGECNLHLQNIPKFFKGVNIAFIP